MQSINEVSLDLSDLFLCRSLAELMNSVFSPFFTEGFNTHLNLFTQRVDLLEQLSGIVPTSRNVTLYEEDKGCPVLDIGLYSTLTMPSQEAFGSRFDIHTFTYLYYNIYIYFFLGGGGAFYLTGFFIFLFHYDFIKYVYFF